MFVRLDPNRSPAARLAASSLTAETSVTNSGREVAAASRIHPVHISPRPVLSAIWSAERPSRMPVMTTAPPLSNIILKAWAIGHRLEPTL
jgi:hypothetical protein